MRNLRIKVVITFVVIMVGLVVPTKAQIVAPSASGSFATDYSASFINGGGVNDLVYVFCGDDIENNIGELQVLNTGCVVNWFQFDGVSYQPMGIAGSIIQGLESGGYMAQVNCQGTVTCHRAWVWVNQTHVDVAPLTAGCEAFQLFSTIDELDNSYMISDPPGVNFVVDESTEITVCFWADHPYVSDLGFYLKAPGHANDEPVYPISTAPPATSVNAVVELLPSVADWGPGGLQGSWTGLPFSVLGCGNPADEGTFCQDGNNVINFCFSTEITQAPCVCDMTTPLAGAHGSAGPWDPIYGFNAGDDGWNVQIYDCMQVDFGSLNRTSISFTGQTDCGQITFTYDSGDVSGLPGSVITDNSCSASAASSYVVPPLDPPGSYTVTSSITNMEWSCTGSSFTSNLASPIVSPSNPGEFPASTANFILSVTETVDVPSAVSCTHESMETFVTTPSDATITDFGPVCYNESPIQIVVEDAGGIFSISNSAGANAIQNGIFYPSMAGPGTHTITYEIGGACPDTDQSIVVVYEEISAINVNDQICDDILENFTVTFDVVNQDGVGTQFAIDDGTSTMTYANSYSQSFPSQTNYSFTVSDLNGCGSEVVQGYRDCGCATYAGTMMSLEMVVMCQGTCTNNLVAHNGDDILDANDIKKYILHDGTQFPANSQSIITASNNLSFCFIDGMQYGVVYYISAVCGNNLNGAIDPDDPCYSQSIGTPVMWLENPVAVITTEETHVCSKEITLIANEPLDGALAYWSCPDEFVVTGDSDLSDSEISILVTDYGEHSFTWTVSNGNCVATDVVDIHFHSTPVAFAGEDIVICGGQANLNAELSIDGSSGLWTAQGVNFNPQASEISLATLNDNFEPGELHITKYLTWIETLGTCSDEDDVAVTFIRQPNPTVINAVDTACGNNYCFSLLNVVGEGQWSYQSLNPDIVPVVVFDDIADPQSCVSIAYNDTLCPMKFVWTEIIEHEGVQCIDSVVLLIAFAQIPSANASIIGGNSIICGNEVTLEGIAVGGFATDITWMLKNEDVHGVFSNPNDLTTTFTLDTDGTYESNYTVTADLMFVVYNSGSCVATKDLSVTFYRRPEANAGLDHTVCGSIDTLGAVYDLVDSEDYTSSGEWYALEDESNILFSYNPNANIDTTEVTSPEYGTFSFIWKERHALMSTCIDTDTVDITFVAYPNISAGDPQVICGPTTTLEAVTAGFNGSWQVSDGASDLVNPNDPNTQATCEQYGLINFVWLEANGNCYSYDTVEINFLQQPVANHLIDLTDTDVCGSIYPHLQANTPTGPMTGAWEVVDGTLSADFTLLNEESNIWEISINTEEEHVQCELAWKLDNSPASQGENFCFDYSNPVIFNFYKRPEAHAGDDQVVCGKSTTLEGVKFLESSSIQWSNLSNVTYDDKYDPTSGVIANIDFDGDTALGFNLIILESAIFEECSDSDTVKISFAPQPSAEFQCVPPKCYNTPGYVIAVKDDLVEYNWSLGFEIVDTLAHTTDGRPYEFKLDWAEDMDSIEVTLTTKNEWSCNSEQIKHVIHRPIHPQISTIVFPDTCAMGKGAYYLISDTLLADTTNDYDPAFNWIDENGESHLMALNDTISNLSSNEYQALHIYRTLNDEYLDTYLNQWGETQNCYDTINILVETAGLVQAEIGVNAATDLNSLILPDGAEVLFDNMSDYDDMKVRCVWYFGDGEKESSCDPQVLHKYETGSACFEPWLVVTVRNLEECADTAYFDCIKVEDGSELEIPNIFTPNGDGDNDYFQVKGKSLSTFSGKIINRWGRTVYTWTDYENMESGWDGKLSSGNEASPGVYYYVIEAVGLDKVTYKTKTGPLQLVRNK